MYEVLKMEILLCRLTYRHSKAFLWCADTGPIDEGAIPWTSKHGQYVVIIAYHASDLLVEYKEEKLGERRKDHLQHGRSWSWSSPVLPRPPQNRSIVDPQTTASSSDLFLGATTPLPAFRMRKECGGFKQSTSLEAGGIHWAEKTRDNKQQETERRFICARTILD